MKQFMVRIYRNTDGDYADVVVDAETEEDAKRLALAIVRFDPAMWFDVPEVPQYYVDSTTDVEDVTGGEYASVSTDCLKWCGASDGL